jgi:FkbM family methyltransferase
LDPKLIYDVGAHNGDDTAYYLNKGFRVVAVEANPVWVEYLRRKFADPLAEGRLTVLNVGIAREPGLFPFYVNEVRSEHSSFDEAAGTRGGRYRVIEVVGMPFQDILLEHGVPYYLKVDIERADRHCIESLTTDDLPAYVSIEAHRLDYLAILHGLGYRRFKVVDQSGHNSPRTFDNETPWGRLSGKAEWYRRRFRNRYDPSAGGYAPGSSGPFGEDTAGTWQDLETVSYDWLHFHLGHARRGGLNPRGWFDFHAGR